jgi:hypothetical protein
LEISKFFLLTSLLSGISVLIPVVMYQKVVKTSIWNISGLKWYIRFTHFCLGTLIAQVILWLWYYYVEKYTKNNYNLYAEHDIVFGTNINPGKMDNDDLEKLRELGWIYGGEYDCWYKYV